MEKIIKTVEKIEISVSATFICISCLMIVASGIFRTFGHPINWMQDFSLLIFAWSVFLGADVAIRKDKLVRVEILTSRFSEKVQTILSLIAFVIIAVFLSYSIYYGISLCLKTGKRTFPGISWLSYVWVTASYPTGSALMLITVVLKIKERIIKLIKGGNALCSG